MYIYIQQVFNVIRFKNNGCDQSLNSIYFCFFSKLDQYKAKSVMISFRRRNKRHFYFASFGHFFLNVILDISSF